MIIDDRNTVVEGCGNREFDSTIERVEWYAFEHLAAKQTGLRDSAFEDLKRSISPEDYRL
jgi:hypothetical protein